MFLHHTLEKRFRWYKKWHRNRYASLIHYVIFALFVAYDLHLAFEIQQYALLLTQI
jgi:hypothetical protein